MPLYEYECDACGQRFELIRKFSDPPVESCAACGKGPVRRLLSSPAIQFKGSGFYITDYAQKGRTEKSGSAAGDTAGKTDAPADTSSKGEAPAAKAEKPAAAPSSSAAKD